MNNDINSNIFSNKIIKGIFFAVAFVVSFYLLHKFACYINKDIHLDALYMDDLYYWSFFGEGESFKEFCFPKTASTYRPIYWILSYIQFYITKSDVPLYLKYNLLLNTIIATFILYSAFRFSKSIIIALLSGIIYLSSYFSYYQIGQMMGTIESYALLFSVIVVYNLIMFLKKEEKYFINIVMAYLFFFLVIFTHERYIGLFVPIVLALILKEIYLLVYKKEIVFKQDENILKKTNKSIITIITSSIILVIIVIVFILSRQKILGTFVPTGTERYDVTENFDIENCIKFAFDQVKFLFGFNVGEAYLSAQNYNSLSDLEKTLVFQAVIPILIIVFIYLLFKMTYLFKKKNIWTLSFDIIFLSSIAMFIASSSVTIRLEMRWIYVSYAVAILYLSFMLGSIKKFFIELLNIEEGNTFSLLKVSLSIVTILLMSFFVYTKYKVDLIYRGYYPNIYFFEDQTRMNNLANITVNKYGVDNFIGKKNVFILFNLYGMTDSYANWFYRPFKYGWDGSGTKIYFINDVKDIPEDKKQTAIILLEAIDNKSYIEVEK